MMRFVADNKMAMGMMCMCSMCMMMCAQNCSPVDIISD